MQILVYSLACERALGEPLEVCALELLHPGLEYAFVWDGETVERGMARVTAAIEALIAAEAAIA
jgi:hypothetical protein